MKVFKIVLCFFIVFSFTSCSKSQLNDLSGFIYNYNLVSEEKISLDDFIFQNGEKRVYTAVSGSKGEEILLSLQEGENGKIEACKTALIKDENKAPANSHLIKFRDVLSDALFVFCGFDEDDINSIINGFELTKSDTFLKTGELTLTKENYRFVYYSTQVISEVMVYNTYLYEPPTTEKPVSKPYYAEDFITKE